MKLTPSKKESVSHQFDSFCKKLLCREARNYFKQLARRSEQETSLPGLSEKQLQRLYVLDEYPSEMAHFDVQGYDVPVSNENLADALSALPNGWRDIVLLSYFLDMTDQEIADGLNMVRRTVQYRRTSSLKEMKRRMEVTGDNGSS